LAAYSPTFLQELQTPDEYTKFAGADGYLGRMWDELKGLGNGCSNWPDVDKVVYCEGLYAESKKGGEPLGNFITAGGGQWVEVVKSLVFGVGEWGYFDDATTPLGTPQNAWAKGKAVVMAGTLLTQTPALTYTKSVPLAGFSGMQTSQGHQSFPATDPTPGGVPLALAAQGTGVTLDLLPGGAVTYQYGTWVDDAFSKDGAPGPLTLDGDYTSLMADFPVIYASAISSAAVAAAVEISLYGKGKGGGQAGTHARNFAPALQLLDPTQTPATAVMTFQPNVHDTFTAGTSEQYTQNMVDNGIVRTGDGGNIDNTAASQLLVYLQKAGEGGKLDDEFQIVILDNSPGVTMGPKGAFPTGRDVADLFGFQDCTGAGDDIKCTMQSGGVRVIDGGIAKYVGISMQVFPPEQYFNNGDPSDPVDSVYWAPNDSEKITCSDGVSEAEQPYGYARYAVTVDPSLPGSKALGLTSSASGTLHVFTNLGPAAPDVPANEDQFACFDTIAQQIATQVIATSGNSLCADQPRSDDNPCTLGDYLHSALGLDDSAPFR